MFASLASFSGALYFAIEFLGVVAAVSAMVRPRTPQGAVAWAIFLIAIPLLALPLYATFGSYRFSGYVKFRKIRDVQLRKELKASMQSLRARHLSVENLDACGFSRVFQTLSGVPFLTGNSLELLVNGDAFFQDLFAEIDAAKHEIVMQFYVFRNDTIGSALGRKLVEKVAQGVRVWLLVDSVGSNELPGKFLKDLHKQGVSAQFFRSTRLRLGRMGRMQVNFRNHRKIVVIDGRTAFVGGINVGDDYLGHDPVLTPWRDTQLKIRGPAALEAQMAFVADWYWATETVPDLSWEPCDSTGEHAVLIDSNGPSDNLETCRMLFVQAINSAQKRLWISSPYVVPDSSVISALQLATMRGVDVRILTTKRADNQVVKLAGLSYIPDLIPFGVRMFCLRKGFLHQKAVLVDDVLCMIGSANFDHRSFALNFETNAWVSSRAFCAEVEAMFTTDFVASEEHTKNTWDKMPHPKRWACQIARLCSPML